MLTITSSRNLKKKHTITPSQYSSTLQNVRIQDCLPYLHRTNTMTKSKYKDYKHLWNGITDQSHLMTSRKFSKIPSGKFLKRQQTAPNQLPHRLYQPTSSSNRFKLNSINNRLHKKVKTLKNLKMTRFHAFRQAPITFIIFHKFDREQINSRMTSFQRLPIKTTSPSESTIQQLPLLTDSLQSLQTLFFSRCRLQRQGHPSAPKSTMHIASSPRFHKI